jgi:hypothetical protein
MTGRLQVSAQIRAFAAGRIRRTFLFATARTGN